MATVADERKNLTGALQLAGLTVYSEPPESPTPPAVVLVPDDPYLEPVTIGPRLQLVVRLRLTVIAPSLDNAGALDTLERTLLAAWAALPDGIEVGAASRPMLAQVGPSELLTTTLGVQLYADLTPA